MAWAAEERGGSPLARLMDPVAHAMDRADMAAVAAYSTRRCPPMGPSRPRATSRRWRRREGRRPRRRSRGRPRRGEAPLGPGAARGRRADPAP